MGNINFTEEEPVILSLTGEDGVEYDATLLLCFTAGRAQRDYCAVLSHRKDKDGQYPIQLFRYILIEESGEEGISVSSIASDMEFEEVRERFLSLIEGRGLIEGRESDAKENEE